MSQSHPRFHATIALDFAASTVAGFDLSSSLVGDLLQKIGAFGVSNYLTGIMLILIGMRARPLALAMLGIIPVAYMIGTGAIKVHSAPYAPSQADWGGAKPLMVYLIACGFAFVAGIIATALRRRKALPANDL